MKTRMETGTTGCSLQIPTTLESFVSEILMPREDGNPNFILRTNDSREILLDIRKGLLIGDLEGLPTTPRAELKQFSSELIKMRGKLAERSYYSVRPSSTAQAPVELAYG